MSHFTGLEQDGVVFFVGIEKLMNFCGPQIAQESFEDVLPSCGTWATNSVQGVSVGRECVAGSVNDEKAGLRDERGLEKQAIGRAGDGKLIVCRRSEAVANDGAIKVSHGKRPSTLRPAFGSQPEELVPTQPADFKLLKGTYGTTELACECSEPVPRGKDGRFGDVGPVEI